MTTSRAAGSPDFEFTLPLSISWQQSQVTASLSVRKMLEAVYTGAKLVTAHQVHQGHVEKFLMNFFLTTLVDLR